MAVPKFHQFMLPLLQYAGDGKPHRPSDAMEHLANQMQLSDEDRAETIPSGRQTQLYNRVTWACTYLVKAGLLERPERGWFRITPSGTKVLASPPPSITKNWLAQFEAFEEFVTPNPAAASSGDESPDVPDPDLTPEELIERTIQEIDRDLADDLLAQMLACSPAFFENLVIDVLVAMGYGGSRADAGKAVGKSGDGGIDGIIKEDRLGLDAIYVQAKRWEGTVGRPVVQAFAGSLEGFRARKGVLITTSHFADTAREYVAHIEKRIILIDGKTLARLMIEHDVGVATAAVHRVKRLDQDYFEPAV